MLCLLIVADYPTNLKSSVGLRKYLIKSQEPLPRIYLPQD